MTIVTRPRQPGNGGAGGRAPFVAVAVAAALALAGCAGTPGSAPSGTVTGRSAGGSPAGATSPSAASRTTAAGQDRKVLVVVEENQAYSDIIGSAQAPYLNSLAQRFTSETTYQAGYPAPCPSLAGYLVLTSGTDHHVCDDEAPSSHPLSGANLFQQVADSGLQWRVYAESMPAACTMQDAGRYLVRHTGAPYYLSERSRCAHWDLPMGTTTSGALHQDLTGGKLAAFSLVIPDACDDMHGYDTCTSDLLRPGDNWLSQWIPAVLASPDYHAGRLTVIITWDESSSGSDNHIPTLVISPTAHGRDTRALTHCSTLRSIEDQLHLPALGCAATATPLLTTSTAG